jgi:outer membrane protein
MGALDADMMLRPDWPLILPAVDEGVKPDQAFDRDVAALINEAIKNHPSVLAAEAQARAADADVRQAEAEGLPKFSVTGQSSRNNQGIDAAQGTPFYAAVTQSNYIGVQVSVPLFEGFSRTYKVRQAEAQLEEKQARLEEARRKAATDFWSSYNELILSITVVENNVRLLDIAQKSFSAASRRYEAGAGTMLELLSAQTALADTKRESIRAETDYARRYNGSEALSLRRY